MLNKKGRRIRIISPPSLILRNWRGSVLSFFSFFLQNKHVHSSLNIHSPCFIQIVPDSTRSGETNRKIILKKSQEKVVTQNFDCHSTRARIILPIECVLNVSTLKKRLLSVQVCHCVPDSRAVNCRRHCCH